MKTLRGHLDIDGQDNPKRFSADVEGVTFLKAQFLIEAKDFFYLRKGEDVNAHLIAAIYGCSCDFDWNNITNRDTRNDAIQLVTLAKSKNWFAQLDIPKQRPIKDYRIICIEEDDTKRGKKINDYLKVDVLFIPSDKRNLYRLYLNDTSFAFFYRHGEGLNAKFHGYIDDSNPKMVQRWKDAFLEEWKLWKQQFVPGKLL